MKSESTTYQLEVIFDYGSVFVAYGKITETKSSPTESSFSTEVPLIKLIGPANLQSPVIARKFFLGATGTPD